MRLFNIEKHISVKFRSFVNETVQFTFSPDVSCDFYCGLTSYTFLFPLSLVHMCSQRLKTCMQIKKNALSKQGLSFLKAIRINVPELYVPEY